MTYKVYIQTYNKFPIADWAMSAYYGFRDKGTEIILFEDIEKVPESKYNILVAYMDDTFKYFDMLGLPAPKSLNIPNELENYLGREIKRMDMETFKKQTWQYPLFIKPDGLAKEFTAGIIKNESSVPFLLHGIKDDCPVLISEVVDFVSEYRCYVMEGKLLGIKHYSGDIRIFPDVNIIDKAILDYKSQPIAYAIDFGITRDGKTLLMECNDCWSLGNYGLEDKLYANMLAKRWHQLMCRK